MVGISMHWAPRRLSSATRPEAWARARVITIFFPNKGFLSNQASSSRNETTCPTTMMAGDFNPAFSTASTIVSRVPVTVCWRVVVPQRTRATGVSGGLPCSISFVAILDKFLTPIRKTRVASDFANMSHCIRDSFLSGRS